MIEEKLLPDHDIAALSLIDRRIMIWKNVHCISHGLTAAQVPIVILVCRHQKISQNDIVSLLGLDKSVISKSVTNLIASGFLIRETDPKDKRAYKLSPTERSMDIYPDLLSQGESCMDLLTDGFSSEERKMLSLLLQKMSQNAARLL